MIKMEKYNIEGEKQTRIELNDSTIDILQKMAGGNPGALRVYMEIIRNGETIDPDAALGGFAAILSLDTYQIYEHHIWILYKDVCNENLMKTIAILRAWQLGFLTQDELEHAIDNYGDGIDSLEQQVKEELPIFGKEER